VLGIHQLGENLSGMAARVEVIGMRDGLAFAPLLTAVRGEDVLIVVVVEVLVLVNVRLGHSSRSWLLGYTRRKKRRSRSATQNNEMCRGPWTLYDDDPNDGRSVRH